MKYILILLLFITSFCNGQCKTDTTESFEHFEKGMRWDSLLTFNIVCNDITNLYAIELHDAEYYKLYNPLNKETSYISKSFVGMIYLSGWWGTEKEYLNGVLPGYELTFKTRKQAQNLIHKINVYLTNVEWLYKQKHDKEILDKRKHIYKPCD